ncbi:PTS fructose transporter subunit IIA [Clostridium botulinum]|nr:PTS fructose transporter subunit IIA [Clostridium botulinum]NFC60840.1 PTS fructose transporter subunit IIA [Clostridium botulinum]NFC69213.1 PTS fructose transporter subunit IIA [Clostridium botulinum]NFE37414.1 PTS fructose transporter subunit IIA [Clostridium botulinum]NFE40972.1 PTS fructose transporter subunit IIA [Clostridium botulinum]
MENHIQFTSLIYLSSSQTCFKPSSINIVDIFTFSCALSALSLTNNIFN